MPISNSSLKLGTADAGKHIYSNRLEEEISKEIAQKIGLAQHPVVEWSTQRTKKLWLPADIEIHTIKNIHYIIDLSRYI